MTRILQMHPAPTDTSTRPTTPVRAATPLPASDRQHLVRHLKRCVSDGTPPRPLLQHVLDHKVKVTHSVDGACPDDLVCCGRLVTWSVDGGPARTGLLTHRARAGANSGVIAVASLLGATLIGMRVGQRAPLLCDDGTIVSLEILNVTTTT